MPAKEPRDNDPPLPVPNAVWIPLNKGMFALIDEQDLSLVSSVSWHLSGGYAVHNYLDKKTGKYKCYKMHRLIFGAESGEQVDHVNHNKLDNRRSNLRSCSFSQNQHNRVRYKTNTSGFKGVSFHKRIKKWSANTQVGGKQRHLGYFLDAITAARAYDEAAIELHGEFSCLNFDASGYSQRGNGP